MASFDDRTHGHPSCPSLRRSWPLPDSTSRSTARPNRFRARRAVGGSGDAGDASGWTTPTRPPSHHASTARAERSARAPSVVAFGSLGGNGVWPLSSRASSVRALVGQRRFWTCDETMGWVARPTSSSFRQGDDALRSTTRWPGRRPTTARSSHPARGTCNGGCRPRTGRLRAA